MPTGSFVDQPTATTSIFVASLRGAPGPGSDLVTRSAGFAYTEHTVSVPPQRLRGRVSPNGPSRYPRIDFFDLATKDYGGSDAFMSALSTRARTLGAPGEVMVFVHGGAWILGFKEYEFFPM